MLFLALNMYIHFRNCKKEDTLPSLFLHVEMGIISIDFYFILFLAWVKAVLWLSWNTVKADIPAGWLLSYNCAVWSEQKMSSRKKINW